MKLAVNQEMEVKAKNKERTKKMNKEKKYTRKEEAID